MPPWLSLASLAHTWWALKHVCRLQVTHCCPNNLLYETKTRPQWPTNSRHQRTRQPSWIVSFIRFLSFKSGCKVPPQSFNKSCGRSLCALLCPAKVLQQKFYSPTPRPRSSAFNKRLERRDSAYACMCQTAWEIVHFLLLLWSSFFLLSILPGGTVGRAKKKKKEKHFRLHPSCPLQPE